MYRLVIVGAGTIKLTIKIMKYLIIILVLFIGCTRKLILPAETDYPIIELVECGYTYDYPFLHVFKDTVHHQSQVLQV